MADRGEFPPPPQPGKIDPSKTTSYTLGPSTRGSTSSKEEDAEAKAKRRAWEASEDERLATMMGGPGTQNQVAPKAAEDVADGVNAAGEQPTDSTEDASTPGAPPPEATIGSLEGLMAPPAKETSTPEDEIDGELATMSQSAQADPAAQPADAAAQVAAAPDPFDQQVAPDGTRAVQAPATDVGTLTPQEHVALQDRLAHGRAQEEARQARELAQEQTRIRKWRADAMQTWTQQMERAQANYEADRKITSYMDDKSLPQRIFLAFAVGLGSMGSGGGPKMFMQAMQQDFEAKKGRAAADLERMKQLGLSRAQIDKAAEQMTADILARQSAQLTLLEKQGQVLLSRFPAQSQKFQQSVADERAKIAKLKMDAATNVGVRTVERGWSKDATRVTEVDGKNGASTMVTEADARAAKYGMRMKYGIDQIKSSPELTPEEFGALNSNVIALKAQAENATKGILQGPAKRQALIALGLSPDSLTSGIPDHKKPAALGWLTASGIVIRDESGAAINVDENMSNAQKLIPQASDGPVARAEKRKMLEFNAKLQLDMTSPEAYRRATGEMRGTPAAEAAPPATPSTPVKAPAPAAPASDAEALAWAKAHPKDPRAIAITKAVAAKRAGRK
jgi:hypothetical protein